MERDFRGFVATLATNGIRCQRFQNAPLMLTESSPAVFLRVDVGDCLDFVAGMAEISSDFDVPLTVFFPLRTPSANPFGFREQLLLRRILRLGHEVGLLCNRKTWRAQPHVSRDAWLSHESKRLELCVGSAVKCAALPVDCYSQFRAEPIHASGLVWEEDLRERGIKRFVWRSGYSSLLSLESQADAITRDVEAPYSEITKWVTEVILDLES